MRNRQRARRRGFIETLESRRLLNAGGLDLSFNGTGVATINFGAGINVNATDVAIQTDGKTVVVGKSTNKDFAVARFNLDGTLDTTFGPNHNGTVLTHIGDPSQKCGATCVAIQGDGKIVVAGQADFDFPGVSGLFAVARYNANGSLDTTFAFGGDRAIDVGGDSSGVNAIAIQSNGKIILGGVTFNGGVFTSSDDFAVVRLNTNGVLDKSFNGNGIKTLGDSNDDEELTALALSHTGDILVFGNKIGRSESKETFSELEIVSLKSNGALDLSFDGDGSVLEKFPGLSFLTVNSAVVQSDGNIVVVGDVGAFVFPGPVDMVMARFLSTGPLDTSFGGSGTGWVKTDLGGNYNVAHDVISSYEGGFIVLASNDSTDVFLGYDADGLVDTTFGDSMEGSQTASFSGDVALAAGPGRRFVAAGGSAFHTARLLQAGANVVSVTALLNPTGNEAGTAPATFFVYRSERLPVPTRVYLDVGGTANPPTIFPSTLTDYTTDNITYGSVQNGFKTYVDIPANQTSVTVTLTPKDDAFIEGTETAVFSVKPDSTYEVGAPASTTLYILDNDGAILHDTADAYVRGGSSSKTSFGTAPHLLVQKSTTAGNNLQSYLKFDLSTLTTFSSVKLQLFGNLSNTDQASLVTKLFSVANTSWNETGITFKNRPASGSTALASARITGTTPQSYTFDITAYAQAQLAAGHKTISLVLRNSTNSTDEMVFNSREANSNGPKLIVAY